MSNPPAFSRSGVSNPLGKCTEEIKTHVPEDMKEKFSALAVLNGQTSSEYLRDVIAAHLYGQFHVVSMRVTGGKGEGQD